MVIDFKDTLKPPDNYCFICTLNERKHTSFFFKCASNSFFILRIVSLNDDFYSRSIQDLNRMVLSCLLLL